MNRVHGAITGFGICSLLMVAAAQDNWPQFRGTNASGVSHEAGLPVAWGNSQNVRWKVPIPGVAWSSPVVWGNHIYVTSAISETPQEVPKKGLYFGGDRPSPRATSYRWELICVDTTTGAIQWRSTARQGMPSSAIHIKNSYASETPVTDGDHVYAYFGAAGLYCFDRDGKLEWNRDLGSFKTRLGWGSASSPVLDGDRLFVLNDNEEQSFLVALDKRSGKELWRVSRDEKSSWSTPFVWHNRQRTELVTCATNRVRSYDPATGKLLWELAGMSVICSPTPVANEEMLYVSSGYVLDQKRPLFAIRAGASGDISLRDDETSNGSVAWCQKLAGPYIPSPLLFDGRIYVLYDRGFFECFDAQTGQPVYDKQRIDANAGAFTSSPWAYDGKIFCLSEDGDAYVIQAGPEFKILAKNSLDEMCMATPAIAGGHLFVRGMEHLYCIE